jgi:hypothetical protein
MVVTSTLPPLSTSRTVNCAWMAVYSRLLIHRGRAAEPACPAASRTGHTAGVPASRFSHSFPVGIRTHFRPHGGVLTIHSVVVRTPAKLAMPGASRPVATDLLRQGSYRPHARNRHLDPQPGFDSAVPTNSGEQNASVFQSGSSLSHPVGDCRASGGRVPRTRAAGSACPGSGTDGQNRRQILRRRSIGRSAGRFQVRRLGLVPGSARYQERSVRRRRQGRCGSRDRRR